MQGTAITTLPIANRQSPIANRQVAQAPECTPVDVITPDGEADQDQIGRTPKAPTRR